MCGISGIFGSPGDSWPARNASMIQALRHRGPDGIRTVETEMGVLGHARLSIIDLEGGTQPMWSDNGRQVIVFNGEIYNYRDLRNQTPYPYKTASDTEVLLALYQRFGTAFVAKLEGMFAFALLDLERKTLFCARDRFGEKPFYYSVRPDGFYFASELKSLLASDCIPRHIQPDALARYLKYLYVPEGSIFAEVDVLPPGHSLLVSLQGKPELRSYWQWPQIQQPAMKEADEAEAFRELFQAAVKKSMVADVPVGCLLSGGLDSTTVAYEMTRASERVSTFSFSYGSVRSELPFAREAARLYNTDHHEQHLDGVSLPEVIREIAAVYDEPFADSSAIGTWLLCRYVAQHVKVALGGDGADELLAGYTPWYEPLVAADRKNRRDNSLFRRISRRAGLLPSSSLNHLFLLHRSQVSYFSDAFLYRLTGHRMKDLEPDVDGYSLESVRRFDTQVYLPGDILVKVDRAAMAHGLELRSPFLDPKLAEFCMSRPFDRHMRDGKSKALLRNAYQAVWPEAIRVREKQGFGGPVKDWLESPEVKAECAALRSEKSAPLYKLVDYDTAGQVLQQGGYPAWILLTLALWSEKWTS